jgi:hypothetical protein
MDGRMIGDAIDTVIRIEIFVHRDLEYRSTALAVTIDMISEAKVSWLPMRYTHTER